jgi:hypothetical protein
VPRDFAEPFAWAGLFTRFIFGEDAFFFLFLRAMIFRTIAWSKWHRAIAGTLFRDG